ncbi:MAG: biotin/lipoyl-binding protein, partial [Vicinamibacterales bacterium]
MHPDKTNLFSASFSPVRRPIIPAVVIALAAVACGGGQPEGAAPPGGAPAGGGAPMGMPVEMMTLEATPIEQASEYVGTVKSRRSTTIQPQVEGFIRRLAVTSGQRVSVGTVLAEIDSAPQQAAIAAVESTRAARQADVTFAKQQADRTRA